MNVVAFKVDPGQWPSNTKLTLPSEKSHVFKDFKDFGATVHKIIDMLEPNLDCWAIYDTGDHPMPYYNKGRVVVLGDAGHATSPHHGMQPLVWYWLRDKPPKPRLSPRNNY